MSEEKTRAEWIQKLLNSPHPNMGKSREDRFRENQQRAAQFPKNQFGKARPGVQVRMTDGAPKFEPPTKAPGETDEQFAQRAADAVEREFQFQPANDRTLAEMQATLRQQIFNGLGTDELGPAVKKYIESLSKGFEDLMRGAVRVNASMHAFIDQNGNLINSVDAMYSARYVEPEPLVIGLPSEGHMHVIYFEPMDEFEEELGGWDPGSLNSMVVEATDEENPWAIVDYLIGEDCTPVTIVAGDEVIAFRWCQNGRLMDETGWRSGDPDKYPVPDEYKLRNELGEEM